MKKRYSELAIHGRNGGFEKSGVNYLMNKPFKSNILYVTIPEVEINGNGKGHSRDIKHWENFSDLTSWFFEMYDKKGWVDADTMLDLKTLTKSEFETIQSISSLTRRLDDVKQSLKEASKRLSDIAEEV